MLLCLITIYCNLL